MIYLYNSNYTLFKFELKTVIDKLKKEWQFNNPKIEYSRFKNVTFENLITISEILLEGNGTIIEENFINRLFRYIEINFSMYKKNQKVKWLFNFQNGIKHQLLISIFIIACNEKNDFRFFNTALKLESINFKNPFLQVLINPVNLSLMKINTKFIQQNL